MGSLYEKLGGEPAVLAAVQIFYQRVMLDELTRPFFGGIDMAAQTRKQVAFMTWAFGGPDELKGRDLRRAHAGLVARGLSDAHFDAVVSHLDATLVELDVEPELIEEVMAIIRSTRAEVLNR